MDRPFFIPIKESIQMFYDVPPPLGYKKEKNFPECCAWHSSCKKSYAEWFEKFPNCCDYHKRMQNSSFGFDKSRYNGVVEKLLNQVHYTEFIIQEKINDDDWHDDITDYIEFNLESFGNPSVGGNRYIQTIINYIEGFEGMDELKRSSLLAYIDTHLNDENKPKKDRPVIDVNKLIDLYERWVKAFPFSLSYFQPYEKYFKSRWPLLSGGTKTNRYSQISKSKLITENELVKVLIGQTNKLLQIVNTPELYEKGELSNYKKLRFDIAKEQYKATQKAIFDGYNKGERKYLNTIKSWLRNELAFYKELEAIERDTPAKAEPTKAEKLKVHFDKYSFENLPMVKSLNEKQKLSLIDLLAGESLPYQIAMLDYLGLFEHLLKHHFTSKFQLHKTFSGILNGDNRAIRGNLSVLNEVSKENRKKYTAHLHKEIVQKDYKNLK